MEEIFGQNYETFFQTNKLDVWCRTWDGSHEGWLSAPVIYSVSKRVGVMGPFAGLMGRLADDHICTEAMMTGKAVREVIEDSVESWFEGDTFNTARFTDQPNHRRQGARVDHDCSWHWDYVQSAGPRHNYSQPWSYKPDEVWTLYTRQD